MLNPEAQISALRVSLEQQGIMQYDGGDPLYCLLLEADRLVRERDARSERREENEVDRTRINFEVPVPISLDAFETFCLEDR